MVRISKQGTTEKFNYYIAIYIKVLSSAANVGVYEELGRKPMQLRRGLLSVKYWIRLRSSYNTSGMFSHTSKVQLSLVKTDTRQS